MLSHYKNTEELKKKSIIIPLNYIKGWKYKDKLKFAHFGRIYGLRKIDKFLVALSQLNKEIPDFKDRIELCFYSELIDIKNKLKIWNCHQ